MNSSLECHARMLQNTKHEEYEQVAGGLFQEFLITKNLANCLLRKGILVKKIEERFVNFKKKKNLYKKLFLLMWDRFQQSALAELSPTASSKPQFVNSKT